LHFISCDAIDCRFGNKEFARFARMSKGSLHESLNHLIDARDQRMITSDELLIEEHHTLGKRSTPSLV